VIGSEVEVAVELESPLIGEESIVQVHAIFQGGERTLLLHMLAGDLSVPDDYRPYVKETSLEITASTPTRRSWRATLRFPLPAPQALEIGVSMPRVLFKAFSRYTQVKNLQLPLLSRGFIAVDS
jgi:hypothetical protein